MMIQVGKHKQHGSDDDRDDLLRAPQTSFSILNSPFHHDHKWTI